MKIITVLSVLVLLIGCKPKVDLSKTATENDSPSVVKENIQSLEVPDDPTLVNLSPMESIKELDRKIESYKSGSNLSAEEIDANRQLKEQIIRGTFDLYELCHKALDKHWESLKEDQRKYFANLMSRLLERKAIFSKEQVKGTNKPYSVAYNKEEYLDAEKKNAKVTTLITVPSEKLDLNISYKLLSSPKGWKIFDVIVDDASLVENYKFQFDTIINKYGYDELIGRMEKKLKEMK